MVKFIIEMSKKEREAIRKSKTEVKQFFKKVGSAFQIRIVDKPSKSKNNSIKNKKK